MVIDPNAERPEVDVEFTADAAVAFGAATERAIGRRIAIVLDDVVMSAPVVRERIGGGRARIDLGRSAGDAAQRETQALAVTRSAGALPASLDLVSQEPFGL